MPKNPPAETTSPGGCWAQPFDSLDASSQKVARHVAQRRHIAHGPTAPPAAAGSRYTRGQLAADAVARFGGSWTFVGLFGAVMAVWVALNGWLLATPRPDLRPLPVHPAEPVPVDAGGHPGADHPDVAEPPGREGP